MSRLYRGADKYLARPGREQARKDIRRRARFQQHRDASSHQVSFYLQGKAPKEINAIQTETLACFLAGLAKDLSASLYNPPSHGAVTPYVPSGLQAVPLQGKAPKEIHAILTETLACFPPGRPSELAALL